MSTSNPVVDAEEITSEIVNNLIADEIQAYADDTATGLEDPLVPRDADQAPFVVTSYPNQQTVAYPHVVVQESSVGAVSFDNRHDLHQADVSVLITVESRTSTEEFQIKDGVRGWAIRSKQDDTLREGGFTDGEIDGSTAANWEANPETTSWQTTISGTVYTA
ncbi:hypothetical protein HRTV-28_gp30 [Halorubrum tailed virus 28]|uniref:Uncharacterized protein n=1 Tax=Halorubrum tailed virus 28 TaxID=2878009 RepID=A0AAE9BYS5_9CAUD|nr:hypothetical protein M1M39_gp31 [Halorubrum tailed virus 28]UBF23468.1 hypothetical protein HRTV-28_gp30 [Halorubrum tailed virus 28]